MRTAEHKLNAVQRPQAYREAVTHPAGGSIVLSVLWLPGPPRWPSGWPQARCGRAP